MKVCALDGGRYRSWPAHFASRKHQRAMHPAGSRKGAKANARRARARVARHQLTRSHERQMYDQEEAWMRTESRRSGRHWYGAWSPWGVGAFMGGAPGAGRGRSSVKRRRHLARLRDLGEI